jgi:hypothetical protein
MKEGTLSNVLHFMRGSALRAELVHLEDRQLLERFLQQHDQASLSRSSYAATGPWCRIWRIAVK